MSDAVLVLNAGSSSIKFSLFTLPNGGDLTAEVSGQVEGIGTAPRFKAKDARGATLADETLPPQEHATHAACLRFLGEWLRHQSAGLRLLGVGHRVVHGGVHFDHPVRIDDAVMRKLDALVPLAPLHQPHNLSAVRAVAESMPGMPQVACFDTSFHRTQPKTAESFGLPAEYYEQGVRRYGFHGLSYDYIAHRLPEVAPEAASGRVIVAHLGNGASMCAIRNGHSVASTMGFTAVDGLPMGTRTGSLDPGVVLYFLQQGMDAEAIEDLLYKRSGLLGLSGLSNDMRELLASDAPAARFAVEYFIYRIGREAGSLAAALGGVDALVFTAGIGENSAEIRARACHACAWLGIELDEAANAAKGPRISTASSRVSAWVIPTNEELMIARQTLGLLGAEQGRAPR
ncbi:MAG TPA: acetate/propionate family kinase [Pelomicrobium sp.]|nr:acetate/propionate family kinase [Pelomicrobium sp.]